MPGPDAGKKGVVHEANFSPADTVRPPCSSSQCLVKPMDKRGSKSWQLQAPGKAIEAPIKNPMKLILYSNDGRKRDSKVKSRGSLEAALRMCTETVRFWAKSRSRTRLNVMNFHRAPAGRCGGGRTRPQPTASGRDTRSCLSKTKRRLKSCIRLSTSCNIPLNGKGFPLISKRPQTRFKRCTSAGESSARPEAIELARIAPWRTISLVLRSKRPP